MSSPLPPAADRRVLAWRLGISAVLVAGIAGLVYLAVHGALGDRSRVRGDFTTSSCTRASYHGRGTSYDCLGSFRAGDLHLPVVSLHNTGRLNRGDTIGATVSGPDANTATPASESRWRLIVTTAGSLILAVYLYAIWKPRRR